MTSGTQWWYCLKHERVEPSDGCANADRMGPYETPQQAERALDIAAARTQAWDEDPRWNDDKTDE